MNTQFPFKCKYQITQRYQDNFNNYPEHHHGAIDIVPLDEQGKAYPAEIFPMFDGSEIFFTDTDPKKGKGIREQVTLDDEWINYFKGLNLIPKEYTGKVFLQLLYWHMLDVTDKDGVLDKSTPIGHCGNTGDVYSGGVKVPDDQKGVPPYLGLHLHLEALLLPELGQYFNLNLDPHGRIDPQFIFNKKGNSMRLVNDNGTVFLISGDKIKRKIGVANVDSLLEVFGDEPIISEDTSSIPETHTLAPGFIIHSK